MKLTSTIAGMGMVIVLGSLVLQAKAAGDSRARFSQEELEVVGSWVRQLTSPPGSRTNLLTGLQSSAGTNAERVVVLANTVYSGRAGWDYHVPDGFGRALYDDYIAVNRGHVGIIDIPVSASVKVELVDADYPQGYAEGFWRTFRDRWPHACWQGYWQVSRVGFDRSRNQAMLLGRLSAEHSAFTYVFYFTTTDGAWNVASVDRYLN